MNHLRRASWLLLLTCFSFILGSCGQDTTPKTYRVGVLSGLGFIANIADGFKDGMAELGYVEGENIVYDVQETEFDIPTYQRILQQFVADEVDLILVFPTEASIEAKNATADTDIPVVFAFALIEGMGLVDSVREPGGNVTGVRYPGPDIALRRFEVLREIVPDADRILIPYQKGYPIVQPQLDTLYPAAEAAGVTLIEMPADTPAELASLLQAQQVNGEVDVDAILVLAEPLTVTPDGFAAIAEFSAAHQLPFGGAYLPTEGYGALFGINVDTIETGKQAAPLADKIFQGISPSTIPVVSAEMFMQIDYRMAQELGLDVPEGLLALADEIIR
ncbi:MAG: ABC transporter substrate-binding protein [Anaerolineales bacterium]|nr:ABC transporter substrate-binding protein [Anaerolineales bacterium]